MANFKFGDCEAFNLDNFVNVYLWQCNHKKGYWDIRGIDISNTNYTIFSEIEGHAKAHEIMYKWLES